VYRNTYANGAIVAELAIGDARFRVAEEALAAANLSPQSLHGTTVRINLLVADPDAVAFAGSAPPRRRMLCFPPVQRSVTRVSLDCCQRAGRG
jgi:hypothetical protein